MTDISLEEHLLNASELFHYAYRFRKAQFVIGISKPEQLQKLIPDLSVLQLAQISSVIICPYSAENQQKLSKFQEAGGCYRIIRDSNKSVDELLAIIKQELSAKQIPVLLIDDCQISAEDNFSLPIIQTARKTAQALGAQKLFLCGELAGLMCDNTLLTSANISQITKLKETPKSSNLTTTELELLGEILEAEQFEIVLLRGDTGMLFQEIFTNLGSGTLISRNQSLICRQAELTDVADICLLLKPAMRKGAILPISESDVIDQIGNFFVYTNNGLIVACACLKDFGCCYEVSKVCTFPRYQGRGLARGLVRELLAKSQRDKKDYVFGLSITQRMWALFQDLGFKPIEKNLLPESWLKNYDPTRPSKAFIHRFSLTNELL
jgi:N-acetylglutamate synthase-like GNAT family acetyltransferase